MKRMFRYSLAWALPTLLLLAVALLVWFFRRASGTTLQDVFFGVGAVPIALFTVSQMGRWAGGRGPMSRPDRGPHRRAGYDGGPRSPADWKAGMLSGLNWVLAGLLLWLLQVFV